MTSFAAAGFAALLLPLQPPLLAQGGAQPQAPAKPAAPARPALPSPGAGPVIVVETEKGTFEFETYPNEAPKTVAAIVGLVNKRFYNGLRFHRVIKNFVVQVGDPNTRDMTKRESWGHGSSGVPIGVAEISKTRTHVRGAVAMAHNGNAATADSQFYVTITPQPQLDSKYVVFGRVISGMDVVTKIEEADRLIRATVREAR